MYKERLVIKGCKQTKGLDNFETYSPVTKNKFHKDGASNFHLKELIRLGQVGVWNQQNL